MAWVSELITDGEIDALRLVASQAWGEDTQYPLWKKRGSFGGGQCYVTAVWLQSRLGGFVGKKDGHFAWLSPDRSYVLDLTNNHTGSASYEPNDGYKTFKIIPNERTARFIKRANSLFADLDKVVKIAADGMVGDAFPGQEPQRQNDIDDQYWHDEPNLDIQDIEYNFFFANNDLEIAPADEFDHDELKEHLGLDDDYAGPIAVGYVMVKKNKATWLVQSNINLRSLVSKFKEYTKQVGWEWNGMTDIDGEPINDDFAPSKSSKVFNYVWSNDHLYIGNISHAALALKTGSEAPLTGTIEIIGSQAKVEPVYVDALESLFEWSADQGLTLYGTSNNLVHKIPDMEVKNLGNPNGPLTNPVEGQPEDDSPMPAKKTEEGVLKCPAPECKGQIFGDVEDYERHRRKEHNSIGENDIEEDGKFPKLPNMDLTNPNRFTPQQPDASFPVTGAVLIVPNYKEAARVDGFDKYAKAFGFYNNEDRFYVSYINGSPVGYGVIGQDGQIKLIQSSVKGKGIMAKILDKAEKHYSYLYSHTLHDWEAPYFTKRGWVNVRGQKWVKSAAKEPKDLIEAAIPFVYDIAGDELKTGHPGQKTSDIPGQFTPGGIVEGEYDKGGKVTIYTATNMPYSVNHLLSLWYNTYPEMTIKSVFLQRDDGNKTKLASN